MHDRWGRYITKSEISDPLGSCGWINDVFFLLPSQNATGEINASRGFVGGKWGFRNLLSKTSKPIPRIRLYPRCGHRLRLIDSRYLRQLYAVHVKRLLHCCSFFCQWDKLCIHLENTFIKTTWRTVEMESSHLKYEQTSPPLASDIGPDPVPVNRTTIPLGDSTCLLQLREAQDIYSHFMFWLSSLRDRPH